MSNDWSGGEHAYNEYVKRRLRNQNSYDIISVVQFDSAVRVKVKKQAITQVTEVYKL